MTFQAACNVARTVWFANDTPLKEEAECLSVKASALGLTLGFRPSQIIVNGYSYSREGLGELYKRDHDGALLKVVES